MVQELIKFFDKCRYVSIGKHERYVAPLFDKYHDEEDYSSESDNEDPFRNITVCNKIVEHFYFDAVVIEDDEIKQLCKIFPNIKNFAIAAENVFET